MLAGRCCCGRPGGQEGEWRWEAKHEWQLEGWVLNNRGWGDQATECCARTPPLLPTAPYPCCRFFEWLSIAHPHNNVHNMRLCRLVADARVLPPEALAQLQAVDRVRLCNGGGCGLGCC